ncbi:MAG: SBBP repeat-containing protein [Candidatus Thorarchaeota archaeon]
MRGKRILLALVLFMLSVGLLQLSFHPTSLGPSETESDSIDETIMDSVVQSAFLTQFYENIGQLNTKDVMYYGRMPGGMIGFGENRIRLWKEGTDSSVLFSFVGADNVTPTCMDEVSRHTSYFLGDRGTYTGIRGYSQITYEELWPGIDLYYHVTVDGVKYEFRVAAGGNPTDIRVRCEGHDSLVIGEATVLISKDNGTFIDEGLRAFQDLTDIDVTFSSHGPNTFGFKVGDYDESQDLIINPLLFLASIGSGMDAARSITVDTFGNAFVTGITSSPDFPTLNAYNSSYGGGVDSFVFKLSADGSALLYSTFIGGAERDEAKSIAVDSLGNAFVTGYTKSPDFPMVNAYNGTHGGGKTDCFVFKLSADGSTLLYSTFVGGGGWDTGMSIAVDSFGSAFIAGYTFSLDFPTVNTNNSIPTSTGDRILDCFVFKLSTDGSNLLYSTLIGENMSDEGLSIAVDSSGNVFVTGFTTSPDFPTVNAYNSTHGGERDCFVFKLSADGSTLLYSTFIGGAGRDEARSIAVDTLGNAFVTGFTTSPDFPTVNAYNSTYGGGVEWDGDCFVFKLSADGSTLLYSTFVGGGEGDWAISIAIDSLSNAYVTGVTRSPDFPMVNAYDSTHGGFEDCFVFKLSADGSTLLYSTFVGGAAGDEASSIAIDSLGNAFVTGFTTSHDFPTVNAYNSTNRGLDCFVFKLSADGSILIYSTFIGGGEGYSESTTTSTATLTSSEPPEDIDPLVTLFLLAGFGGAAVVIILIAFLSREA